MAALLAGLGVVCGVMGAAFIWHSLATRRLTDTSEELPPPYGEDPTITPVLPGSHDASV